MLLQVIWVIGGCFLALAALAYLPRPAPLLLGLACVVGQHFLPLDALTRHDSWYALIYGPFVQFPNPLHETAPSLVQINYSLLPWLGVMLLGFGLGPLFQKERSERRSQLCKLALLSITTFLVIRALSGFGNHELWTLGDHLAVLRDADRSSWSLKVVGFFNASKYPPSLAYITMTLGPTLLLLAYFDREPGPVGRRLLTFGRVPLLYYVAHLFVTHLGAGLLLYVERGSWDFPLRSMFLGKWVSGDDPFAGRGLRGVGDLPDDPVPLVPTGRQVEASGHVLVLELLVMPTGRGNAQEVAWIDAIASGTTAPSETSQVKRLDLGGLDLERVPDDVANCTELLELNLYGNRLAHLPDTLSACSQLSHVNLGANALALVPGVVTGWRHLECLVLGENRLQEIPDALAELEHLRTVDLAHNRLGRVPEVVRTWSALPDYLYLGDNGLTDLPAWLGTLTRLRYLGLDDNALQEMPSELGRCAALQEIRAAHNLLTHLPPELGALADLRELHLRGNRLTTLPASLQASRRLEFLDLRANPLGTLPAWLVELPRPAQGRPALDIPAPQRPDRGRTRGAGRAGPAVTGQGRAGSRRWLTG